VLLPESEPTTFWVGKHKGGEYPREHREHRRREDRLRPSRTDRSSDDDVQLAAFRLRTDYKSLTAVVTGDGQQPIGASPPLGNQPCNGPAARQVRSRTPLQIWRPTCHPGQPPSLDCCKRRDNFTETQARIVSPILGWVYGVPDTFETNLLSTGLPVKTREAQLTTSLQVSLVRCLLQLAIWTCITHTALRN
jgi:hypothetical protein